MHHLTKDLLSTKITKATEGSEIFDYKLRALRTTMLKSFRSLRKLFRRWLPFSYECLGLFSRQDAKNAKFGFIFSFAAFAPLREIFRVLVAAQTRWVLRGQIRFSSNLFWLRLRRTRFSAVRWAVFAVLVLIASLIFHASSSALEIPPLTVTINDFAKMIPPASIDDLTERLRRIRSQTGYGIVILTVRSLEDEDIESFGRKAFKNLPLTDGELQKSVLLIVARKEQKVGVQVGSELRSLFPQPQASRKLQSQVEIYFNGMRPDLGIHAGVHYIFGVIQGDFHVDSISEEEGLEDASKRGAGAGAIFAVLMAPFFAFFVGMLWGVYATQYGVHRETRLFIGAVLGGGMAKIVAIFMTMMGTYSEGLWYFILALSVPLGIFGSLTEYWMQGDWSGIPRVKDKVKRKPEDNMGI